MTNTDLDRRFRTRPGAPWQGWGVWPGQILPNPEQVAHLLGKPGQAATKYRAQQYPTIGLLQRSGPQAALEYVEKTGGVDAWRFRAPEALTAIAVAQAQAELPVDELEGDLVA